VEPKGHVKAPQFEAEVKQAETAGLRVAARPIVSRGQAVLLKKV
jgi:hypothetical protein